MIGFFLSKIIALQTKSGEGKYSHHLYWSVPQVLNFIKLNIKYVQFIVHQYLNKAVKYTSKNLERSLNVINLLKR